MNARTIDQTKLLGFDMVGNPLFDLVVPAGQAVSPSVAAGTVKAEGIAKAAGADKMVGVARAVGSAKLVGGSKLVGDVKI